MKIRIWDRVLIALAGLILIAGCAAVTAQVFFHVDVVGTVGGWLSNPSMAVRILVVTAAAVLLGIGVYCLLMLFRRRRREERFVPQKTESGTLEISMTALESLVRKCLEQHSELETQRLTLENRRDGLLIQISGNLAGGLSMPLTVDLIQRQIKQYVTACSGIAVRDIVVQIEATGETVKDSPFAVEAPAGLLLLKDAEETPSADRPAEAETAPAEEPEAVRPPEEKPPEEAAAPKAEASKEEPEESVSPTHTLRDSGALVVDEDEEDDRPIHQRLFSSKSEPCIVPVPPEMETEEGTKQEEGEDGAPESAAPSPDSEPEETPE